MCERIPVSAVVPTRGRGGVLRRALASLLQQSVLTAEFIVVDASVDEETWQVVDAFAQQTAGVSNVRWFGFSTMTSCLSHNGWRVCR